MYRLTGSFAAPVDALDPDGQHGAALSITPSGVTVPPHGRAVVDVQLSMTATAARALPNVDFLGGILASIRGAVTATANGGPTLTVPFLAVPRALSDVTAGPPSRFSPGVNGDLNATVSLANRGLIDGSADVYEWGLFDPADSAGPADIRAAGVQAFPGGPGNRFLTFAINTWQPHSMVNAENFSVLIDTDGDGRPDYAIFNAPRFDGAQFNGTALSLTQRLSDGVVTDGTFAFGPFNTSVIELPTDSSAMGLSPGHGQFSYTVTASAGGVVDGVDGVAHFDAFDPGVSQGDFVDVPPGAGATLGLTVHRSASIQHPLGWMIVSIDDANGPPNSELIRLDSPRP
jgi:hypothetical protein